ncbi:MAG: LeuA family protein [Acidobacteriota bacterium]
MINGGIPDEDDLIFDWNAAEGSPAPPGVQFDDETLRDGIQSPSVRDPGIEDKLRILHLMAELGIDAADLGLPGASERQQRDVGRMLEEVERERLDIFPNCAARTLISDIAPICDVADSVGIAVEIACFIGSSPIRQYAEEWDLDRMLHHTEEAVSYAVSRGMPVMYVTEDTTRARPETLRRLYTAAIEAGAGRICVCDTVGHVTPAGVAALISFIKTVVEDSGEQVVIDWHGHRDRGLDIANTLAALAAGASRVHGTALGIGERSGNTPMDLLLVNCRLLGWIDNDLSRLREYCETVSRATGVPIPFNYPIIGPDAFRTATGVHAAAVIKARNKGAAWLADRVYCGVPAGMVGRSQRIEVGPMSGASNVECWMREQGLEPRAERVAAVLAAAKAADHVLSAEEIAAVLEDIA